jgi:ATP-dependent DNA ligase
MIELMKPKKVESMSGFDKQEKYIYEIKEDGGSAIIYKHGDTVQIFHGFSDSLVVQNYKYPELVEECKTNLKDGEYPCELCVFKDGVSQFNLYLKRQSESKVKIDFLKDLFPITAVIYDITKDGDEDITNVPLLERKKILSKNVTDGKHIKLIEYSNKPDKILEQKDKLEGVVIKDINSFYRFGKRDGWFKFRFNIEETLKIEKFEDTQTGIVLITNDGGRINLAGNRSSEAKRKIMNGGFVEVEIAYHEKNEDGHYRFAKVKRVL